MSEEGKRGDNSAEPKLGSAPSVDASNLDASPLLNEEEAFAFSDPLESELGPLDDDLKNTKFEDEPFNVADSMEGKAIIDDGVDVAFSDESPFAGDVSMDIEDGEAFSTEESPWQTEQVINPSDDIVGDMAIEPKTVADIPPPKIEAMETLFNLEMPETELIASMHPNLTKFLDSAEDINFFDNSKAQEQNRATAEKSFTEQPAAFTGELSEEDLLSNVDSTDLQGRNATAVEVDARTFYLRVLKTLLKAEDLGIDTTGKGRIAEAVRESDSRLPQLMVRELIADKIVTPVQLSRAIARSQSRKEVMSFLDVPPEAMSLRQELNVKVVTILRDARVIPLWSRVTEAGVHELHLAYEAALKDLMLESALAEHLHGYRFYWHFAMRDVCGAYWLSGESEDVDAGMEAEALLDRIVGTAIDARSSDIHIDPSIKGEAKAIVKYRIDGMVQSKEVITLDQLEKLKIRIENVARMPKVNDSHPNKGAFSRAGYDWRVQVQPHAGRQGPVPRIVIRRLQPDVMPMEVLGYPQYFIDQIKECAMAPNGVIFWTGPTGSGKTESIHSAVVSVNPMGRGMSLHTIEDPPEKRVPGYAVQMEISETDPARSGLELLKSSLRADPDVIIFGEVRDTEMAGLVFEAANTGHLVFTTLHTNTALDAIIRLDEMGISGFLISYIRGITAQRLVRRLCIHCRKKVDKMDEYTSYIFEKYGVEEEGAKLYQANKKGCPSCNFSGYHGRIAIAEFLAPSKELVEASSEHDYSNLEEIARRAGWKPMGYMATLHVKNGITDSEEIASKVLELSGDILD